MLSYAITAVVSAVTVVIFARRYFDFREALCSAAHLLSRHRMTGLLNRTGLKEFMRPDKVEEVTTPDGFKVMSVRYVMETGIAKSNGLKLRKDDVFVCTYPKSGTTWMQEIVWLICNNADIENAPREHILTRVPYMEFHNNYSGRGYMDMLAAWPKEKQRLMKSHLPYEALPRDVRDGGKCKIIYVARNPKDVCVSLYFFRHVNLVLPKPGTWDEFLRNFLSGRVLYGSWFPHVLTYWRRYRGGDERIFFTTYEEMQKDLKSVVIAVAKFLAKDLTESQIDAIVDFCSLESMRANDSVNYKIVFGNMFMRKGKVGDWKNYFTLNQNAEFDALYETSMRGTDLKMTFDL